MGVVAQELCQGQLKQEHTRIAFTDGSFLVFVELVQINQLG